jgi:hypothetical protein
VCSSDLERVLKDNELLISEWAPIHLARALKENCNMLKFKNAEFETGD